MEKKIGKIKPPTNLTEDNQEFWLRFIKLGFASEKSQYPNDLNFLNLLKDLNRIHLPSRVKYNIKHYSISQVIDKAKKIQDKMFNGVDLNVSSFFNEFDENENQKLTKMYESLDTLDSADLISEEEYIKRVKDFFIKNRTVCNVFDIPVLQTKFNRSF